VSLNKTIQFQINIPKHERINGYTKDRKTGITAGHEKSKEPRNVEKRERPKRRETDHVYQPSLKLTEAGIRWIFCWMFSYTSSSAEVALRCCKTEHYYPSSPLPRTLRRPGSRVEEDAIAKTKNPGNYGQGPLTPTLPPFNPRRDLSPDSWFLTFISRSNIASCFALFTISRSFWFFPGF